MNEVEWRQKVVRQYVCLSFATPIAGFFYYLVNSLPSDEPVMAVLMPLAAAMIMSAPIVSLLSAIYVLKSPARTEAAVWLVWVGMLSNAIVICPVSLVFLIGFD